MRNAGSSNRRRTREAGVASPRSELLLNRRFHSLCVAFEILPDGHTFEEFEADKELNARVMRLIRNGYLLLKDGSLDIQKATNGSGPVKALQNERSSRNYKRRNLDPKIAMQMARRLLGFVLCEGEWTLAPRRARGVRTLEGAKKKSCWDQHREAFNVVPKRVRDGIRRVWESNPDELSAYVEDATAFLKTPTADALPEPPWNRRSDFENGHAFIFPFLKCVEEATRGTTLTVAAVQSYITASAGRELFLRALELGVRVRFLIFDFLNGDSSKVARMIHRCEEAFYSNANDTIGALLELRKNAKRAGVAKNLEIRLLKDDPVGRWYILDSPSEAIAFFALRDASAPSKSADARGGRVTNKEALKQINTVNLLWARAHKLDLGWKNAYQAWKLKPEMRRILGHYQE